MKSFQSNLERLNKHQLEAVQTIEGPVLVVAGPGTGKTQLLGMRAANIVKQTDTPPQSILCLTYTDSAAAAMRKRLVELMGPEGNKVAVHTFHSFGAELINQNSEYFYNGGQFKPADELSGYEILNAIFKELPHSSPLAATMNGEFAAMGDTRAAISHLKRAGLLPSELLAVLDHNQEFYKFAEPTFKTLFASRLSKKSFAVVETAITKLALFKPKPTEFTFVKPIAEICLSELRQALAEATETGKTTPLTSWRNNWLQKDESANFVFKDGVRSKKQRELAKVYEKYLQALTKAELFDFDDMVSSVAHTLEQKPELRFNLQEQYLYIMVDEFQDTNGAQLRLLSALAENPINEGRPNILAVGDDDQAIYAFQGAELSNILGFTLRYRDVKIITLTQNYRSSQPILDQARGVITKADLRLETTLRNINKSLSPNHNTESRLGLHQFNDPHSEYEWVATTIANQIAKGEPASEIAVIARNHKQLTDFLPHLHAAGIVTNYERRNNVLENQYIKELITLVETVVNISEGHFDLAEEQMPKLLSYNFWQIKTSDIWRLSLAAHKSRRMWLELMLESEGKLKEVGEFLVVCSRLALREPLEKMLDILIGTSEQQAPDSDMAEPVQNSTNGPVENTTASPFRDYYFSEARLKSNPDEYLTTLSALRAIRQRVLNHVATGAKLLDLVELINLYRHTETPIVDTQSYSAAKSSVAVMTAHKAKGLEFGSVYIIGCQDEVWGRRARHRSNSLGFPHNLPIEPAGAKYDDALRLFFVAITRAKHNLFLSYHLQNGDGRQVALAEFLLDSKLEVTIHALSSSLNPESITPGWELRHLSLPQVKQAELLRPVLETYKLSATHINNFVDVSRGGPQAFLLQNLLRFPQATTPNQAYGFAVHRVLQRAHTHLSATGERRPIEDILYDYELQLQQAHMSESDMKYWLEKGCDVLSAYLKERYQSFTPQQISERNFYGQDVVVGNTRLTGVVDLLEVDKAAKTIVVTDYKTGKPLIGGRTGDEFAKIKLHKYRQQLMFYKLLVERSRDYAGYTVEKGVLEFVEPAPGGKLHNLEFTFSNDEMESFRKLVSGIWKLVTTLNFPDTSQYQPNYKGILDFESNLLAR